MRPEAKQQQPHHFLRRWPRARRRQRLVGKEIEIKVTKNLRALDLAFNDRDRRHIMASFIGTEIKKAVPTAATFEKVGEILIEESYTGTGMITARCKIRVTEVKP